MYFLQINKYSCINNAQWHDYLLFKRIVSIDRTIYSLKPIHIVFVMFKASPSLSDQEHWFLLTWFLIADSLRSALTISEVIWVFLLLSRNPVNPGLLACSRLSRQYVWNILRGRKSQKNIWWFSSSRHRNSLNH